jgi:succinoglycan biosynthesis transport protein ExoP
LNAPRDTRLARMPVDDWKAPLDAPSAYSMGLAGKDNELRHFISFLLRRKWVIVSAVLITTSAVALYVYSLPSIYEASATIQLDVKQSSYLEDAKGNVLQYYDNDDYQNTQIKLLSNPQLMRQVILKLDLEHNPNFINPPLDIISRIRRLAAGPKANVAAPKIGTEQALESDVKELTAARTTQLEPYVAALLANLKVEPQQRTSLVSVTFAHTDPVLAMQVVDTLTKLFVANSNEYETKGAQTAAATLGRQIFELQTKIKEEEEQRLNFLKTHNLPLEKGQGRNITEERLGMLSSQLLNAEDERKKIEATYEAAKNATDPMAIPEIRNSEDVTEMVKSVHQLEQRRASLLQIYTPQWPEVKRIDSEMAQLKANIEKTVRTAVDSLKAKLDAAVGREAKLREAYYQERGAANSQTQEGLSLADLNQQIETNRQVYNMLFQRQTEMEVNAVDKSKHAGIVTPPVVPLQPIGPARLSNIGIAFLASLLAGIGLAVLINQFDNTLKTVDDVTSYVFLPTLALIPSANGNGHRLLNPIKVLQGRKNSTSALALTEDVRSPAAEAYRHLRSSLLFTSTAQTPRSILITSGQPYEGKTTTAINTAIAFAQTSAEVLLIDCDLRHPRVHQHFGFPNKIGLTNYLSGQEDIESLFRAHAGYPTLKVITAGPMPSNPADFLGSTEMRYLLETLSNRFAHIIVDSPPAGSFADAGVLSTQVDGVVIVADSKRTSRALVRRIKERLEELGATIYGVVLNRADLKADNYYYSGYYSKYYKYYKQDSAEKPESNGDTV